jgi:peptidoglycan/xylan/chitin deacetylase (PgdA/CDA1 family)
MMGDSLFRLCGRLVSPGGERGRLVVLMYHRVLSAADAILHDEMDAATFEEHMALMAAEFNVLPLSEACDRLAQGRLPERAACITFDDGYADNEETALPILKRYGLTATFFVASGFSEGGIMWNDAVIETVRRAPARTYDLSALGLGVYVLSDDKSRRAAIDSMIRALMYRPFREVSALIEQLRAAMSEAVPKNLMMNPVQIRRLSREGMEIGGHTLTHPILALLDHEQARLEIVRGKRLLEEITDAPVRVFAYPVGKPARDYGARDMQLVRDAGFTAAVSTTPGVADRNSDRWQLPRLAPWDRNGRRLGMRLLFNCARTMYGSPRL